jgi:hypothetical protein
MGFNDNISLPTARPGLDILSIPGRQARPTLPPQPPQPHRGVSFLDDILPTIITGFSGGMAARQRDPEALMRIVQTFLNAKDDKRREQLQQDAQSLRETREARLAEMSQNNENLRLHTEAETARRNGATESRQKSNDLNTLINTIEDNMRATLGDRMQDPAAVDSYIRTEAARVESLGGKPEDVETLLRSIATQASQPGKPVPLKVLKPGEEPPATVEKGTVVRNAPRAPQPKAPPRPIKTTDEDGNEYLTDPTTGKRITPNPIGKRPKTGGSDAIAKIIQEATAGGVRGGAPTTPAPKPKAPAVGEVRKVNGKSYRWDGKGWLAQ